MIKGSEPAFGGVQNLFVSRESSLFPVIEEINSGQIRDYRRRSS